MTLSNQDRLSELFRRRKRDAAVPDKIKEWSIAGYTASAFSHERHEALLHSFRVGAGERQRRSDPLDAILSPFGSSTDMVAVIGWNVEEDPGILVPGRALCRSDGFLRDAYPNGFVLADQPLTRILLIDFDDIHVEIEEINVNPCA